MRVTAKEVQIIQRTFQELFGSRDQLWLFGSRADDKQQGGDIDLYIETYEVNTDIAVTNKLKFATKLWESLGEQKIDIILNQVSSKQHLPIYKIAKESGVKLI